MLSIPRFRVGGIQNRLHTCHKSQVAFHFSSGPCNRRKTYTTRGGYFDTQYIYHISYIYVTFELYSIFLWCILIKPVYTGWYGTGCNASRPTPAQNCSCEPPDSARLNCIAGPVIVLAAFDQRPCITAFNCNLDIVQSPAAYEATQKNRTHTLNCEGERVHR